MATFQKDEIYNPVNTVDKIPQSSMNRRTAVEKMTMLATSSALPDFIGAKAIENMHPPISACISS